MSKFLLIGSVAAVLYGDCAWGMGDDIDPWKGTSSGAGQFNAEPARGDASPNIRSRRNSTAFSRDAQTQTEQSPFEQSWSGQAHANPQQLQENRFIKIKSEYGQIYGGPSGAVLNNTYMQYHYVPSNNSKIGRATPTTVVTVTRDDLRCWNDISEIRYANDVSYDKLENPKVILYRNKDNSCYIILRIGDNKHGVFYGVNERNVEIGRQSFAVYEVSEDVGSFTDGVPRRIYVDESGLYFVPVEGNSIKDVIKTYQAEGKFNFRGAVIKVSAIDGSITRNGEPITEDNFFDNWVEKEIESGAPVSGFVFGSNNKSAKQMKTVLSTEQPKPNEILRNFYPPKGDYIGICGVKYESNGYTSGWLNSFINKRFQLTKAKSKNGAEELVRDGVFASILSTYANPNTFGRANDNYAKVHGAVVARLVSKGKIRYKNGLSSVSEMVSQNSTLFKDPEFVKGLKPTFKELEKNYEHNKESELWLPFEIVRNL